MLEAAASKVPVISTAVGSVTSFIDSKSGLIVDLDGFKDAMIEVIDNYEEAKLRANELNKYVTSNLDIRKIVKQYETVYENVLE